MTGARKLIVKKKNENQNAAAVFLLWKLQQQFAIAMRNSDVRKTCSTLFLGSDPIAAPLLAINSAQKSKLFWRFPPLKNEHAENPDHRTVSPLLLGNPKIKWKRRENRPALSCVRNLVKSQKGKKEPATRFFYGASSSLRRKREGPMCHKDPSRRAPSINWLRQRNKSCITLFWNAFPLDERHL